MPIRTGSPSRPTQTGGGRASTAPSNSRRSPACRATSRSASPTAPPAQEAMPEQRRHQVAGRGQPSGTQADGAAPAVEDPDLEARLQEERVLHPDLPHQAEPFLEAAEEDVLAGVQVRAARLEGG